MDITNIDEYEMSKIIRFCVENPDNCQSCPAWGMENHICHCIRKISTDVAQKLLNEIDVLNSTIKEKRNTIIGIMECNTNLDKMVTDLIAENSNLKNRIEELEWRDVE
jgi:predicted nuclease with TOPRIM domain